MVYGRENRWTGLCWEVGLWLRGERCVQGEEKASCNSCTLQFHALFYMDEPKTGPILMDLIVSRRNKQWMNTNVTLQMDFYYRENITVNERRKISIILIECLEKLFPRRWPLENWSKFVCLQIDLKYIYLWYMNSFFGLIVVCSSLIVQKFKKHQKSGKLPPIHISQPPS